MTVLRLTHEPLKITKSNIALQASKPEVVLNTLISYRTMTTTKSNNLLANSEIMNPIDYLAGSQ